MPGSLVLDLETKRSFEEVGGVDRKAELGVSVVGVYDFDDDRFAVYREGELDRLGEALRQATAIIGFNLYGFDWPVLEPLLGSWVRELPTIDLMQEAQAALGHRVSLDALARGTLGAGKLGSGLDALEYYRQGDWERLERYCLEDVKLTRDLYLYALRHGHLLVERRGRRAVVPVGFAESPFAPILRRAARRRGTVRIVYGAKERAVEVHRVEGAYFIGFCQLRKEVLTFRLDRLEEAEEVPSSDPLF